MASFLARSHIIKSNETFFFFFLNQFQAFLRIWKEKEKLFFQHFFFVNKNWNLITHLSPRSFRSWKIKINWLVYKCERKLLHQITIGYVYICLVQKAIFLVEPQARNVAFSLNKSQKAKKISFFTDDSSNTCISSKFLSPATPFISETGKRTAVFFFHIIYFHGTS